jgi:pyruvate/2-oxoglutarate dehydrogenase complex dihydrolipoamide dehydrogenase (E3) component
VAEQLAVAGWSVLGVEPYLAGGECPYFGCIPSKMVIRGAELLAEGRRVNGMSGTAQITPDYTPVAKRIRTEATDDWNDQVAVDRFTGKGGTFARGNGRLVGRDAGGRLQVEVGDVRFTGDRVVLSTGTAPAIPSIEGLAALRKPDDPDGLVWTNREVLRIRETPESLIVIGGGAVGVELAQGLARFGVAVTVIEGGPRLLAQEEPEASAVVTEVFRREGIDVRTNARTMSVRVGGAGVEVVLEGGETLTAAKVLCATGRHSNLDQIGLSSIGMSDELRHVDIDEQMRVLSDGQPVPGLFAVGDITGRGAFTHVSVFQAEVLVAHFTESPAYYAGYHGLAWVTFTDPEIGRVGMTEAQAHAAGLTVRVASAKMSASTRGWIHGPGNDGVIKLVADQGRGVLVGATIAGPSGGEMLGLLTLAVHAGIPLATLASMHYAYPTLHRGVLPVVTELLK